MDRRTFLKAVPAVGLLALAKPVMSQATAAGGEVAADAQGVIKLNPPDLGRSTSLMQSLKSRKSTREYSNRALSLQQLSDVLWAADGVSRPDGKRTSPAAMGVYSVDIYAVLADGAYLFDPVKQQLTQVAKGDHRRAAGSQDFVSIVPLNLVYVSNPRNTGGRAPASGASSTWAAVEVGCMVQNVYLYCAAAGLASVVRGLFDANALSAVLKVKPEQIVITQTVGVPRQSG